MFDRRGNDQVKELSQLKNIETHYKDEPIPSLMGLELNAKNGQVTNYRPLCFKVVCIC